MAENVRVEYDEKGEIIGVEIYNISSMIASSLVKQLREMVNIPE